MLLSVDSLAELVCRVGHVAEHCYICNWLNEDVAIGGVVVCLCLHINAILHLVVVLARLRVFF